MGVFQAKLYGEEGDISRYSWSVPGDTGGRLKLLW